jgi:signal transduction histidine kinase
MRGRLPGGLRGRLLLAFVLTSAVTLAVVSGILLGPLREQLREQSTDNLELAVTGARPAIQAAWDNEFERSNEVRALRQRTDARVLVANTSLTRPDPLNPGEVESGFEVDTEIGEPPLDARLVALRALRLGREVVQVSGDDVSIAVPIDIPGEGTVGALVAQRRLTEVTTAVDQVRNALIVAAGLGMIVAVALGVALSTTLLRRLARLRAAALRITAEGPDAPAPKDEVRDEVGDLARTLARMQEALRRQEVARRSFVSTASHELRTPLTMLQGTMELLEEDLRDGRVDIEDAQLQVTNARRELRRLSTLAGELLDLSRLDAAVQLRSEPVELGELARAVAAEFDLRAREHEVELRVLPPADGCWGRGDPDAVARVVRILLDNALRYGPHGQVITVTTTHPAGVSVTDHGPGIPPEEREHVFERFHRGRASGPESGFGLGLAIGRELAERMGGRLELADREPPGACFVLTLAAAEPEDTGRPRREPVAIRRS